MDSSSRLALTRLFGVIFPQSKSHLSVVYHYMLKLCNISSNFRILSYAKALVLGEHWNPQFCVSPEMVEYFMEELQEIFVVPQFQQLHEEKHALKRNEILAAFIDFLLQLLCSKTDLIDTFEGQIDLLMKELRFLITFFGDISQLGAELEVEQVKNLLSQFEAVANEAGSFVYSFIFQSTGPDKATLDSLLKHIDLLKTYIITFSFGLPNFSKSDANLNAVEIDSLFLVDSVLNDLEDLMNGEDDRIVDVKAQIKLFHQRLMFSQSFLKDIKVSQHSEIEGLKGSVMRIIDVAYEAEFLINSFLVLDAPLWYLIIRIPGLINKIKFIGKEIQQIKNNCDIGALKVAKNFSIAQPSLQAKRNSEVDDFTVGFEDKAIHVLDQLLGGTEHLQIVTIFGMPGLGKTTLAKKLYNNPSVNYHFDKHSWCVVSQTYQRKNLLIDVLISVGIEFEKDKILNMEEESLKENIYKSLKGRRYLIVMDDIWDSNVWDDLRRNFPDDRNGSRMLFTSRNKDVAPPDSIIYALPPLSNDQCWELLKKKVFHNKPCPSEMLRIGAIIAKACHGLPLAVVVIAGSSMDKEESMWKTVEGSLGSYIFSDPNNSMMQILKLSYKHLPHHLKPCFLYFGAFPEDKEIPVNKLKCL